MEKYEIGTYRHSLAHIMAKGVLELYPGAKLAIGPAIDDGFYYDFELPVTLGPDDYETVNKKIKEVAMRKEDFTRYEISREEALALFADQPYKVELIQDLPEDETITYYSTGENFIDLCAGPHVENARELLPWAFQVASITGAYWRGDSERPMLQRIYVYAFPDKAGLKAHLKMIEEAKKRDHRKLGPQLDLFFFDETAPGMPYWLPKGWKLFNALMDFWREEHEARGYQEISSPQINHTSLWKTSGHWGHYKENMFITPVSDEQVFAVKPMNCPNAMIVYKRRVHSYRDLPLRYSDCDVLHRREVSGTLHGLLRVQMFRQDDSHNFIREDQIFEEISNIFEIADLFYGVFGLKYRVALSTRPDDFMGDIALWDKAEAELTTILDGRYGKGNYNIKEKDGAFYGPKIDIMMEDSLGRVWQTGTIQLDFQLPGNFGLTYTDRDGSLKTPVVIHRVVYGSMERFIGLLIEHFAGAFPFWISPVQVGIVPIRENHNSYGLQIQETLRKNKIRAVIDLDDSPMGPKIKQYRHELLPYILIVGDEEMSNNTVSLRARTGKQINNIPLEAFVAACSALNTNREIELKEEF